MRTGTFPFGDPDEANGKNGVQTMIARIMKVDITPLPEALAPELKELLKAILVADPTKRPSIQQVRPAWLRLMVEIEIGPLSLQVCDGSPSPPR